MKNTHICFVSLCSPLPFRPPPPQLKRALSSYPLEIKVRVFAPLMQPAEVWRGMTCFLLVACDALYLASEAFCCTSSAHCSCRSASLIAVLSTCAGGRGEPRGAAARARQRRVQRDPGADPHPEGGPRGQRWVSLLPQCCFLAAACLSMLNVIVPLNLLSPIYSLLLRAVLPHLSLHMLTLSRCGILVPVRSRLELSCCADVCCAAYPSLCADQLDRVIDACGSVFHIRDAIAEARAQADTGASVRPGCSCVLAARGVVLASLLW